MFRRAVWMCGCLCLAVVGWTGDANAQQYTRISVSTAGTQADQGSRGAVFSGDSKFVAFSSPATNLVTGDTNGTNDVFIRDLAGHTTTRVSVATDGTERPGVSGMGATALPHTFGPNISVSQDGSRVAFSSTAAFDPTDNNAFSDIYVRNRTLNTTTLVSVASNNAVANNDSGDPQMSGDGRYVVFTSTASNLVFGDQNGVQDVFLRDLTTLTTTRISVSSSGNDLPAPSYSPRINADGSLIVFVSESPISGVPDPVACAVGQTTCGRAYLFDRTANTMTRLPLPPLATANDRVVVTTVDITPDGRFILMSLSHVYNTTDGGTLLAVYDRQTGRISPDSDTMGSHGGPVTINASGRFLSIGGGSLRTFLIGGLTFDRQTTSYLDAPDIPVPPTFTPAAQAFPALRLTPDGMQALFNSGDALVGDDTNGVDDIYLLNRDRDGDGMPDVWETAYGLDPANPADAALDADADGTSNVQEYLNGTDPKGTFKRYFAEGAANSFFTTRFAVFNPGDQSRLVYLELLGANGQTRSHTVGLSPHGWSSLTLTNSSGEQPDTDFSTVIESDGEVVVDRTMSWDQTGYGSHAETAMTAPGTTWYLAEGSTGGSFDLFYLLQNPGNVEANVTVNYLLPAPAAPIAKSYVIAPKSRRTIYVDTEGPELAGTDVSAKITADQPILAERAMYFSTPTQPFAAGHEGAAVEAPATSWFFAEGATGSFFDLFLLLANAEATDATVQVTYLLPIGAPVVKSYEVKAKSRLTINVDFEDPRLVDTPVSTVVASTNGVPIIAERAMWWPSPNWYEAHLSAGATTTGTVWALADGLVQSSTTAPGSETETYVLIANTGTTAGTADVTLYFLNGTSKTRTFPLLANSRLNVQISAEFPEAIDKGGYGTIIRSNGVPIVVERAMYSNSNGQIWAAGTDALATKLQ